MKFVMATIPEVSTVVRRTRNIYLYLSGSGPRQSEDIEQQYSNL